MNRFLLLLPLMLLGVSCSALDPRSRFGGFETEGSRDVFQTIHIRKPGTYDYHGILHIWKGKGEMSQAEYQDPILHVHCSNVVIRNFAYQDSPEGVHVGALDFSPHNMRQPHARVTNVRFEKLQALNIGEDAMTLQPNTGTVTVVDGVWRGNRKAGSGRGGGDKVIQNDGGQDLVLIRPVFYDASRAIRVKSNTKTTVIDGTFIKTDFPVMADGLPNPRKRNPFYLGEAGLSSVHVRGAVAFRPKVFAKALQGSVIHLTNVKQFGGKRARTEGNGRVVSP